MTTTHETLDDFLDAAYDQMMLIRAEGDLWLGWETEDGDWYIVRPRHDEDDPGPEGDEYRPVGPASIEGLRFPIQVAPAFVGSAP